tara:strand:+ start:82 stop:945 length:864 start_codon:yes stop_codon:yes gene_type:complete
MKSVLEALDKREQKPFVVCDFSPPKGGAEDLLSHLSELTPDMFLVAYAPGKSVRINPIFVADWIQTQVNIPSIFTMSTRDMNKNAIQSLLLGAQLKGLDNVFVVKGDEFVTKDSVVQNSVNDFVPTDLMASIKTMNERRDFLGKELNYPTSFCIGAALDISRPWQNEACLTKLKIERGCEFLISQPVFDPELPGKFMEFYKVELGEDLDVPIMWGIQMVDKNTVSFATVPEWINRDLEDGHLPYEIAIDLMERYLEKGINTFYLIPTIFRGGRRDYLSAQAVIEEIR